ncbi:MAG: PAS domain-containing protein [Elusimicrobia bacterium]|nr:PAS domain-containing protein [Elusimicrobiota bacterium]
MKMTAESIDGLRPLLDSLTDGVCIADESGKLLYANAAAGELLGVGEKEAVESALCGLLCGRLEGVDHANCPLKQPGGAEDSVTFEGQYDAGPDRRNLRVRCLRVRRARGERHFVIIEDTRREAELARRQDDWRHMFAHDLRSPLTNVLGVLRMVQEKGAGAAMGERDLEMIALAVRSCERIKSLLESYLTVARMGEGSVPVSLSPTDVGALVKQCFDEEKGVAADKQRTLECGGACVGGEGCWAATDRELLHRVLLNLLDNALKFTMTGGVVHVSVRQEDGWVAIRVADDGAGIPAADLPHIFERFYQAKGVPRGVGFGLGLTFCREALRAMGGEIDAESQVGKGSAFTVRVRSCPPPGGPS